MSARKFPILLAHAALTACATMAGTNQIVSLDSHPRGVEVLDEKGRSLGRTPVFARIEREPEHVWTLRRSARRRPEPFVLSCSYRPVASMLANGTVALLGVSGGPLGMGLTYGAALGLDLWTGAAFDCPQQVLLPPDSASLPEPATQTCPKYVIAPPAHDDEQASVRMADLWWESQHMREPCATRVPQQDSQPVFRRLGATHDAPLRVKAWKRRQWGELGWRTQATHLVVLEEVPQTHPLQVHVMLYDLHTGQGQAGARQTLDLDGDGAAAHATLRRWIGRHVTLLPDSFAFSPSVRRFFFAGRGGWQVLGDAQAPSWLPGIVGNWTMTSVKHPGTYAPWDLSLQLGPELIAAWDDQILTLGRQPKDPNPQKAAVTLVHAGVLYGATGTLHTPAGAFSLRAGGGGALTWHWRDGAFVDWDGSLYLVGAAAWTIFVSENLFLRFEAASYATRRDHVVAPDYALSHWNEVKLAFGWYVPEWRSALRRLF